jgi:hypothetical protein
MFEIGKPTSVCACISQDYGERVNISKIRFMQQSDKMQFKNYVGMKLRNSEKFVLKNQSKYQYNNC